MNRVLGLDTRNRTTAASSVHPENRAAIAHLAHSTPSRFLFSSTDFNSYVTVSFADGAPWRKDGRLAASREPGLGVRPTLATLGPPVVDRRLT